MEFSFFFSTSFVLKHKKIANARIQGDKSMAWI